MSFLGFLFGAKKDQQTTDALDAKLQALNNKDYAPGGKIYQTILERDGIMAAEQAWKDVQNNDLKSAQQTAGLDLQYNDAFIAGAKEGLANVEGGINATLKAPFQFAWKAIPWQIWAVGIVAALIYLGGINSLKRIFK